MAKRRLRNFKANRRGYISLWIFLVLFAVSAPAEFIANDKPLIVPDGLRWTPKTGQVVKLQSGS